MLPVPHVPRTRQRSSALPAPRRGEGLQTYVGIVAVLDGVVSLQRARPRVLAGGGSHGVAQPVVVRHLHGLAGGTPVHAVPYDGLLKTRQDKARISTRNLQLLVPGGTVELWL